MTLEEFYEATKDMPKDAPILISQVGGLWTQTSDVMQSELHFGNNDIKVIFIKTSITPK